MTEVPPKVTDDVLPPETLAERLVSPRVVPLLLATGCIVVCYFSFVPLIDEVRPSDAGAIFLLNVCSGVICAGAGLVAIGGVIGPGPFLLRMAVTFGLAVLFFAVLILGWAVSDAHISDSDKRGLMVTLLCLPIVCLSIQIPLWVMRFAFAWRCEFVGGASAESELPPLTIRKLMMGTTLIALALAGARAAVSVAPEPASEFWLVLAITCASTAGISLISTLPIVWSTLRPLRHVWWISGLAVYVAIATVVTLIVVGVLETRRVSFREVIGSSTAIVSFAAMMTATLLSVRLLGFRLLSRNPLPE